MKRSVSLVSAVRKSATAGATGAKGSRASRPAKTMSIGVVLERLRVDFPDVTVSKIRFLESEGLVSPQRTASGYRRFTEADVDRLRYVLTTQRDHYLPLKVIREQLEAMDAGKLSAVDTPAEPLIAPEKFRAATSTRLSDGELATQAKSPVEFVGELVEAGIIAPDRAGLFTSDDLAIVSAASALNDMGLGVRQIKMIRTSALREADMISQICGGAAGSKRQQNADKAQQASAQLVSLHASLMKSALRSELS